MRVALTGGGGFTGNYVVAALQERGHEVMLLQSDIRDQAALREEVCAVRPEAAIHLAALAFVHSSDFESFYQVNQVGTFNLLDALAQAVPGSRVLVASSAQVYGIQAEGLLDESCPVSPFNHYAVSKLAMELGAPLWSDRLSLTITRPFNYTGIGQQDRYLIPKIVSHFRAGADQIELGNLDVQRDFGDVRAVADAYCGLIERDGPGITVNVSTGKVYSIRQILAILEKLAGRSIEVRVNPAFVRANDVPILGGANTLLQSELPGWEPRSIEETLAWMLEFGDAQGE